MLIGAETASRRWVNYEIQASITTGNGLFGIYIDNIKDQSKQTDRRGANPLPAGYPVYDWVNDSGHTNLARDLGGTRPMTFDDPGCEFCEIVGRESPDTREVYRTADVVAFFPLQPATLGHTLLIP